MDCCVVKNLHYTSADHGTLGTQRGRLSASRSCGHQISVRAWTSVWPRGCHPGCNCSPSSQPNSRLVATLVEPRITLVHDPTFWPIHTELAFVELSKRIAIEMYGLNSGRIPIGLWCEYLFSRSYCQSFPFCTYTTPPLNPFLRPKSWICT